MAISSLCSICATMAPMHDLARPPALVVRARAATGEVFFLLGLALGAWTARIPAIKHGIGLSDGRFSLALLALAGGAITGQQIAGRLVDRFGSAQVMRPAAFGEGVLLLPMALANSLTSLAVALAVFGICHGILNVSMNASGIEVQRAYGRPIMSSFHAIYSIGGFAGASVGGLFASADLSPATTFLAVGVACLVLATISAPRHLPSLVDDDEDAELGSTAPLRGVAVLGALVFCALVGEGAAADWSAVYLREDLASSAGFAAVAYAAFSVAMTASRLRGDWLVTRLGPVRLARVSAAVAAGGLGVALLIGQAWAGVLGFACLGAGVACIAPLAFSAAGEQNPTRSGTALARVVSIGYAGFLTGPILIGAASTATNLPVALTVPVVLVAFVAIGAGALRPGPRPARRDIPL
jgi:MFS family permease